MRPTRPLLASAALFTGAALAGCVLPTERDDEVRVSVAPLPILIRGDEADATATAWRILASGDSTEIQNVTFVWSSDVPSIATVDQNGHIVGIKSGTTTVRAAAANFDKRAVPGEITLRVSAPLEIDSVRPQTVEYGQTVTVYGVGVDSIFQASLGTGVLIPYFFSNTRDATGAAQVRFWVPPPAHTDSLFFIGNGVFGFSRDTIHVVRRDLYEPNETAATVIDLETSRPFPGTPLAFLLFFNPALSFEALPRDAKFGADWYRFQQSITRDLTIVLNSSEVGGTFQTFLTDSLGFRAADTSYFVGRDAWTFGPQAHACHGAAFAPKEAPAESTIVAFKDFPAGTLDVIGVYTQAGRYALTVAEGYGVSDKRIARDAHEEDDYCNAADAKRFLLASGVPFKDTLTIDNPHDVDWIRLNVPPGPIPGPVLVRLRTAPRPLAAADSSDIDLYLLNVPAPGDAVMTGVPFARAGSVVDTTLLLAPKDYYAVVVDFAGVPTRYAMCIGLGSDCDVFPSAWGVRSPAPLDAQASAARRARFAAAIRRARPFR